MFARASSGTIIGVDAHPVTVEAFRSQGLPGMSLVGLARGAVRESAVRVRSAINACGFRLGHFRLVVNLLPAELPKEESAIDLPVAVALLAASELVSPEALAGRRFYGELSLAGALEPVRGAVLVADLARRASDEELLVPIDNVAEAAVIPGVRVIGVRSLQEVVAHLQGTAIIAPSDPAPLAASSAEGCFSEVRGQRRAKRALELAAAGGHNVLLIGPPGSGKTMLARRLPTILPELHPEESFEVTRIQSAAGLTRTAGLVRTRPFRAPHHTASDAALCGGGSIPRPGEITLAHRGVLFLDELPEFSRRALESLREPLELGSIHIARASMSVTFPADVLLVAAMNPCPCGRFRGDLGAQAAREPVSGPPCLCSLDQVQRYRSRISGPLLDRIDLHVVVDAVAYRDYAAAGEGESSAIVRERVIGAREREHARLGGARYNAGMSDTEVRRDVPLGEAELWLIEQAIERYGMSTRAIGRTLKVARTVADLAGRDRVGADDIAEAIGFRILDRDPVLASLPAPTPETVNLGQKKAALGARPREHTVLS